MLSDDFRPQVEKAYSSFDEARKAMRDWAEYMLDHQHKAKLLEADAAEAKRKAAQEKKDAEGDGKEAKKSEASDGDDADPLERIREKARTLHEAFEAEGGEIARRLKKAGEIAPNEPGRWDKLMDKVGGALKAVGDFLRTTRTGSPSRRASSAWRRSSSRRWRPWPSR
ncbi:hypothetical protein NKH77_32195 [Streptomyces sp. M19]